MATHASPGLGLTASCRRAVRLAIHDNIANNGFIAAKALRRQGVDADLVLDPLDRFVMSDPRWDEVDLELPGSELVGAELPPVELPDWVRSAPAPPADGRLSALRALASIPAPAVRATWVAGRSGANLAARHAWVVRTLRGYDCVLGFGLGALWAALGRVPCVAHTWGGDIMLVPFYDEDPEAAPDQIALARLQRYGYSSAQAILLAEPRYRGAASRLGLDDKATFTPYFIDTDMYTPARDPELRRELTGATDRQVVFVPSRQDWRWKGSDIMLRGFAELLAASASGALLVCAGWGADFERSRRLAGELGILERVRFLPHAMSKPRLLRYYRAADVVMDQFTLHSLGGSSFEAMSCECPLIASLDAEAFQSAYGETPPLREARTPEGIGTALSELLGSPDTRAELGGRARAFVQRHYGDDLARRVAALCHRVATPRSPLAT